MTTPAAKCPAITAHYICPRCDNDHFKMMAVQDLIRERDEARPVVIERENATK